MTFVCLWSPEWATGAAPLAEMATALLEDAPRVKVEARGVVWADGRGLPVAHLARTLLGRLPGDARAGVAGIAIAAEMAARAGEAPVTVVEPGRERGFMDPLPVEHLEPDQHLLSLLGGVGIRSCGQLAALEREAAEVRFGAAGAALWRLSRADDPRLLFDRISLESPNASLEFVDYTVSNAAHLVFTAHALLGNVSTALRARGERARHMTLALKLASGGEMKQVIRLARPTSERAPWLRRIQDTLERLRLPGPVIGVSLRVDDAEAASATQGDIFDRGFATASAVTEAVARLIDEHGPVFVEPELSAHPLAERRTRWVARDIDEVTASASASAGEYAAPCLALHLLAEPRPVEVQVRPRRDHHLPVRYHDGRSWQKLVNAAGPDRISGGQWEDEPYAREYFRCATEAGAMIWIFRDEIGGRWYAQGYWD
ncbi:MAG TPA: hypothetical protein VFI91_05145 [Longimicrobiaceae bacterium]|nr:hypothetical protein [Longimicrobiaceae bacterium]